jgi:hypothetical protein
MKKHFLYLFCLFSLISVSEIRAQSNELRIVFIRHAEKPKIGDNLTCQGLNRALKLPAILYAKFGIPAFTFVPSIGLGEATKHSRMFQTVMPLAAKYNLVINSAHQEQDSLGIAANIKSKTGTVLVLWEHKGIAPIVRSLGVNKKDLIWPDDDYDSIWILTYKDGKAILTKDKEGITPSADCTI